MLIEIFKKTENPELLIGEFGSLFSITEKRLVKPIISRQKKNAYYQVSYKGNLYSAHVLVAEAFIKKREIDVLVVNHKDGNGLNNHYLNLEWVTYSENSIHAYKTGLRQENKQTFVKDLLTGEVTVHYSQAEAARFIGCSPGLITLVLKGELDHPIFNKYEVRLDENWKNLNIKPHVVKGGRMAVATVTEGKGAVIHTSVTAAAVYTNLDRRTISRKLTKALELDIGYFAVGNCYFVHIDFLKDFFLERVGTVS